MGILPFILGGFLTLVIAMSAVSYQAWKATNRPQNRINATLPLFAFEVGR
jgi:hypothetical protein